MNCSYLELHQKNDLVHFTVSSHFILCPKAEVSKSQPFFSKGGTLTRLLGFGLWPCNLNTPLVLHPK
jgi:hypothetical protein